MFLHLAVAAGLAPANTGPACRLHRAGHRYSDTLVADVLRGYSTGGGFSMVYLPSK